MEGETVKISSHTGIAAAVPYLLGFIPNDSLVVIGLEGDRDRMTFTMRVDLPTAQDRAAVVCDVARRMLASGVDRVLVLTYTDQSFRHPDLPEKALVAALQRLLEVREALL